MVKWTGLSCRIGKYLSFIRWNWSIFNGSVTFKIFANTLEGTYDKINFDFYCVFLNEFLFNFVFCHFQLLFLSLDDVRNIKITKVVILMPIRRFISQAIARGPYSSIEQMVAILVFTIPLCLMFWPGGIWIVQSALVLVWFWALDRSQSSYVQAVSRFRQIDLSKYFFAVVIAYFIWSVITIVFLHSELQSIDNALIFLLWCLIAPVLLDLKINSASFGYGSFFALILALLLALTQFYLFNLDRAFGLYGQGRTGSGAIKFGNMALLLGVLAFLLLHQSSRLKLLGKISAFLGMLICLYASSRGGVLAIGLCLLVWQVNIHTDRFHGFKLFLLMMVAVLVLYGLNEIMDNYLLQRVKITKGEIDSIFALNFSSSMGIRIHLWYAAILMFMEHPLFGVGLNNFGKALKDIKQMHVISDESVNYAHAHNEFLCALATGGLVGCVLTVLLFIIPLKYFRRDYQQNEWAKAGFWSVCLMSFFALTDCIFDRRMTVMAFILLISICMAGNMNHKVIKTVC